MLSKPCREDLLKIIIDKLLIGGLLVIGTLLGNSLLDRYKTLDSARLQTANEMVQKGGEVWQQLYFYEANVDDLENLFSRLEISRTFAVSAQWKREIREIERQIKAQKDQITLAANRAVRLIEDNRYYLGPYLTQRAWQHYGYVKILADMISIRAKHDEDNHAQAYPTHEDISTMREQLSRKGFYAATLREQLLRY